MLSHATREALCRLRRLEELDARRRLEVARVELARALATHGRALEAQERAEARCTSAQKQPLAGGRAGRLAAREAFVDEARAAIAVTVARAAATARAVGAAEHAFETARSTFEAALRARDAADAYRAQQAHTRQRARARRAESAVDDRWRPEKSKVAGRASKRRPKA
jgi:hypothetical protein